jgi:chromosome segregation ATPase
MNDEISLKNEELRYIRNDSIELDKEVLMLKDDTKKLNKSTTDIKKEKENLKNGIVLLKKHIVTLKEKIEKQDVGAREFLNDVSILLNQSYHSVKSIRGTNK